MGIEYISITSDDVIAQLAEVGPRLDRLIEVLRKSPCSEGAPEELAALRNILERARFQQFLVGMAMRRESEFRIVDGAC